MPIERPTLADVRQAADRIRSYVHRTPVFTCTAVDSLVGAHVFFKCESFQRTGAFKFRGACNTVFSLSDAEAARGVVTFSSGNHAQGVALAAKLRGIPAYIVMPDIAPEAKKAAVAGYGGKITLVEYVFDTMQNAALDLAKETGATLVHPFNDPRIIAGQGTIALELLEDVPDLDVILTPVGGGGMLAGTAVTVSALAPSIKVYGSQSEQADLAVQCLRAGKVVPAVGHLDTIADGLKTSLGEINFPIIRDLTAGVVTVHEDTIVEAMKFVWERAKLIIEPSSAVPLAALMEKKVDAAGARAGIIISGGNVDLDALPWMRGRKAH
jgi:threonine dehydratase